MSVFWKLGGHHMQSEVARTAGQEQDRRQSCGRVEAVLNGRCPGSDAPSSRRGRGGRAAITGSGSSAGGAR